MIKNLFSEEVVTAMSEPDSNLLSVRPEEEACVRGASDKRRADFILGRALARKALAQLDVVDYPLLIGRDRAPAWPPGVVGSISHCSGLCGVAVARRGRILGLGLDLEVSAPLPSDIIELVCTPAELHRTAEMAAHGGPDWLMLTFSAKESLYKALYPLTQVEVDFQDVEITILSSSNGFTVHFLRESLTPVFVRYDFNGRFTNSDTHIGTGVTIVNSSAGS